MPFLWESKTYLIPKSPGVRSCPYNYRFCKPLVGSSILSPGTNKIGKIRLLSPFSLRRSAGCYGSFFFIHGIDCWSVETLRRGRFDQDQHPVT
jgi:hypothetical protein